MPAVPAAATSPSTGRRRWGRALVAVLGALALAWAVAWSVGSQIARRMLTQTAEELFDARFEAVAVRYLPPFWLVAQDVALTGEHAGGRVAWLRVPSLRVRLASLPLGGGIPAVAQVTVSGPVVTVLRDRDGVHDLLDLWRGDAGGGAPVVPHALTIERARIEVIDRTGADAAPDGALPVAAAAASPPLTIGDFDLDASLGGHGVIAFTLRGGEARLDLDAAGTLDPSTWQLALDRLEAHAAVGGSDAAPDSRTQVTLAGVRGNADLRAATATLDDGAITVGGTPPIAAEGLRATIALADEALAVSDASARVAGGVVRNASLTVRFHPEPGWQATGEASDLDLSQIARRYPQLGGETVRGRASGRGTFSGAVAVVDEAFLASLRGQGQMRVTAGRFYEVPLVAKLLEQAHMSSEGATLTEAAARFHVADATIHLDDAVFGSTAVGVQGGGTVGFDGQVALDMTVVPLGSWRERVQGAGVPLIGGALASLAGKVQSAFGSASAALYQFRIGGTVQDPVLTPVPVPALTDAAAEAFGHLATHGWTGDVLGE